MCNYFEKTTDSAQPRPLRPWETSPCKTCQAKCTTHKFRSCTPYHRWINRVWSGYQQYLLESKKKTPNQVWRYEAPSLVRDYLGKSPCKSCFRQEICGDLKTCRDYENWFMAKWTVLRSQMKHLQDSGDEVGTGG